VSGIDRRIQNRFQGGTEIMAEVITTVNNWVSRGLSVSILTRLALDIFDIVIPPSP
jgi:hypothetical protein